MNKHEIFTKLKNLPAQKILVVQTAFLGDVILITPLIRAIKINFPNAILDVIVIKENEEVLRNNPNLNSIYTFDKKKNKIISFLKNVYRLKKIKYDAVFTPHSSVTTGLMIFLSGIKYRIGFERWFAQNFLNIKIKHLPNTLKIKKNLYLISSFDGKDYTIQTELFPNTEMFAKAENILENLKKQTTKIIAIAPGSIWPTKMWLKQNYKELADKLVNINYGIIMIGSKNEKNLANEIIPDKNSINLAGELSILESAAVIKYCDLMICNDSGAMHIANAMGTDVFAIFGPTTRSIGYYPFRKNDIVFEVDLDCRPCSSHGSIKCPLGHFNCMKNITVDWVFSEVKKKFGA